MPLNKYLAAFLSSAIFVSLVGGHEEIADDWQWVSQRLPEPVPGLEAYEVAHYLDLPLDISYDFFKDQIVNVEDSTFRESNIFSAADGDG